MSELSDSEKGMVTLIVVWLLTAPFIGLFLNIPVPLMMGAPFILLFMVIGLVQGASAVLMRLQHLKERWTSS